MVRWDRLYKKTVSPLAQPGVRKKEFSIFFDFMPKNCTCSVNELKANQK